MEKNVFGVLNTADKIDGADYIVRSNSREVLDKLDQITGEAREVIEKGSPTRRWALLRTFLLTLSLMSFVFGIFRASAAGKLTFLGILQASPVFMTTAVVSLCVATVMVIIEKKRMKQTEQSEALAEWKRKSEAAEKEAYEALGVPADAVVMDLFTETYTQKNGAVKNITCTAFNFQAWVENNCLCFADVESVVAIPLDQIVGISELPGKTYFYFWNKAESPQSATYQQYQIRRTYLGAYSVKGVRAAHIRGEFGEYELLIPPYELETFLRLTEKAIRPGTVEV